MPIQLVIYDSEDHGIAQVASEIGVSSTGWTNLSETAPKGDVYLLHEGESETAFAVTQLKSLVNQKTIVVFSGADPDYVNTKEYGDTRLAFCGDRRLRERLSDLCARLPAELADILEVLGRSFLDDALALLTALWQVGLAWESNGNFGYYSEDGFIALSKTAEGISDANPGGLKIIGLAERVYTSDDRSPDSALQACDILEQFARQGDFVQWQRRLETLRDELLAWAGRNR